VDRETAHIKDKIPLARMRGQDVQPLMDYERLQVGIISDGISIFLDMQERLCAFLC
jgi:hypothetical protein